MFALESKGMTSSLLERVNTESDRVTRLTGRLFMTAQIISILCRRSRANNFESLRSVSKLLKMRILDSTEICVLFVLLSRTDVTARPGVVSSYTAKRSVGVCYNFTRLTVFDKQNGQSGNQRLSRQVIAWAAKEVACATVDTKDEG